MTTVVLNTVTRKVEVFSSARDVQARAEIADHKGAADPHPQYLAGTEVADVALSGDAGDLIAGTVPDARMPIWAGYNLASRAALEAASVPAAVVGLRLLGHSAAGDGGGAHYKRVASEPAHAQKVQSADGAWWEELFAVDVTVNIPSDFPTLQEAIDRLSKQPVRQGVRILLNIESGHALTAGVNVANGDYSRFWIQSADAEVLLAAGWPDSESVMVGTTSQMPVLHCLINAGFKGRVGIWANNGSTFYATGGSGIKNMGNAASGIQYAGLGLRIAHGSRAAIGQTIFSGAGSHGIQATQGVLVHASAADFSNAGGHALMLSRGAIFHGHDMDLSGAGLSAVRAGRVYASVRGSNCQNAGEYGIWAFEGSIVAARGANCSGAGIDGVKAFQGGSYVDIDAGTINNCVGNGISATDGSKVVATGCSISGNGGSAITISHGSTISARDAVIDGAGGAANTVKVEDCSQASLTTATISNSPGNGLRAEDGSVVSAAGAVITGSAAVDISISRGAIVSAHGAQTSSSAVSGNFPDANNTNVTSFNSPASNGIIFG